MGFLIENDYDKQIREEVLAVISQNSELILRDAEEAAISQMSQYLSVRFDVAQIFIDVQEWSAALTFNEGDMCWLDDAGTVKTFIALQASTNEDPLTQTAFWVQGDSRNPVIKMKAVDIVLYHLHSNIAYQQMPETRVDRYKMCIQWLKDLRDGKLNDPTLPILLDEDGNVEDNLILTGGQPKRDDSY